MKLSIIVPVYKAENFLCRCLDSIIFQDNGNLELILVNDGSPDNSEDICIEYEKKYAFVKYIYKNNGGVSSARNAGLKIATGDYVWFVDSDDTISENAIQTIFEKLKSKFNLYEFGYNTISKDQKSVYIKDEKVNIEDFDFLISKYVLNNKIKRMGCNKIFDRSIIEKNKIMFDEKIKIGEDFLFALNFLSKIKTLETVNNQIYCYYDNDSSAMHVMDKTAAEDIEGLTVSFNNLYIEKVSEKTVVAFSMQQFMFIKNRLKISLGKENLTDVLFSFYEKFLRKHKIKEGLNFFLSTENASFLGKIKAKLLFFAIKKKNKFLTKILI